MGARSHHARRRVEEGAAFDERDVEDFDRIAKKILAALDGSGEP